MKREIKFRGKRIDNGEWVYGNLFIPDKGVRGIYICPETSFADFYPGLEDDNDLKDFEGKGIALGHFFEVDPETVGQHTGLKDKNGNEIYEGDILSDTKTIYTVEYNIQQSGFWIIAQKSISNEAFVLMTLNSNILGNGYYKREDMEAIGNIYENPELLR